MFHYKRDILDFFPDKAIVTRFCDSINHSNADIFILMAHKAIQMVQVLRDQGYIDDRIANKIIISSQSLDFDCSYLIGKRIAIIDDIVISGTSIASAVNKLLHIGIPEDDIDIIALARDKDYQTMRFESNTGRNILCCDNILNDEDCIKLSYLISKAFSFYGTPYDIDYPIYPEIDLRGNKLQLFFNHLLWRTESTTNIDQQAGDVTPYILFPTQNVLRILWKKLGADLSDCVHMKIRAYVRRYPSGRLECSIVPMCLFNEIAESDLENLYARFEPRLHRINPSKGRQLIAQMRYLEFYIAHQMYLVFNDVTSFGLPLIPTKESLHLLFGYNDGDKISAFLSEEPTKDASILLVKSLEYFDPRLLKDFLSHPIGEEMAKNIAKASHLDAEEQNNWINQIILAPFIWWYDTREIPARKEMMFPVKHYIRDYDKIEKALSRLRSGFSLRTIQYLISGNYSNSDAEIFVSLFVDHAIDRGIIVPTIFHNTEQQYLCRAYRHGEDLPFSLEDECRLAHFLLELCERIPDINISPSTEPSDSGLSEIAFEKMIVLFYQMGIRKGGIFNRFLGFNNIKILKPFLSLHGAIQAFVDPQKMKELEIEKIHFYSEKDASGNRYITWLTYWAKENGFAWNPKNKEGKKTSDFLLNGEKIRKYLEENKRSCIDQDISARISDIATMVAIWYNRMIKNGEKAMFKDEATALTSCSNAHIFVSAIATELHYFKKFWLNQVQKAFNASDDFGAMKLLLTDEDEDERNTANIIQGLNSGRNKVKWYFSGAATEVVNKVSNILKDTSAHNWVTLWATVRKTPEHTSLPLSSYIDQVVSFLYFYSACNDCLTYKPFWQTGEKPSYYDEFQSEYAQASKSVRFDLTKNWFESLNEVSLITDFSEKKTRFFNLVNQALHISEALVDNIEEELEEHAPNYTISYISSLIFEVDALNANCVKGKIMEVWNQQTDLAKKTQLNIVQFPQQQETNKYHRYGLFYGISTNYGTSTMDYCENGKYLLSLFEQLCQAFNGQAKCVRGILLPHTPSGLMFRHSSQRKIAKYAEKFMSKIVHNLQAMYVDASSHQLVLAMTDSVEQDFTDCVHDLNWYDNFDCHEASPDSNYAKIVTFYNHALPIREHNDYEKVFYSTIMLNCGSQFGMGFLVKTSDRVVCVTCNHILECHNKNGTVITARTDNLSFKLRPIKQICVSQNPQTLLPAESEVAVLEPLWQMRIPYDLDCIISSDALDYIPAECIGKKCQCCGCINQSNRIWKDSLYLVGPTDDGYYQIDDQNRKLRSGCSGGIAIVDPQNPTILGMHKGRIFDEYDEKIDEYPLLIPGIVIKEQIKKLEGLINE